MPQVQRATVALFLEAKIAFASERHVISDSKRVSDHGEIVGARCSSGTALEQIKASLTCGLPKAFAHVKHIACL